jgi:hypothetical protein
VAASEIFGDWDVELPAEGDEIAERRTFGEPFDAEI